MAGFTVDDTIIRKLAELLNETGLTEIEFSEGDVRLRVARQVTQTTVASVPAMPMAASLPGGAAPAPARESEPPKDAVTSPMVGTAYLAPEPGAAPFVKVGDSVREGQTIVIVEAMKVMNPIKAPRSGKVSEILVTDAQPVEFGEPLMVIG